jgi:hypothetical protein
MMVNELFVDLSDALIEAGSVAIGSQLFGGEGIASDRSIMLMVSLMISHCFGVACTNIIRT